MTKRYLVTGAAGLIGFEVTKELLRQGGSVLAIDNFIKGGESDLSDLKGEFPNSLQIVSGDLTDANTFSDISGDFLTIFHLAAIVGVRYVCENPYETIRVNTLSTLNLIDFAMRKNCSTFAFASSSENYASAVEEGWVSLPTDENVPLAISDIALPRWSYAASKIAGESAVFSAAKQFKKFKPIILRFHNIYGPRMQATHVIPELIERCLQKTDPFPVYGYDASRSFLHVEDAAKAVCIAANAETPGLFNIGSDEEVYIADLVKLIFEACDFYPSLDPHPAPEGSVTRRVPDTTKLKQMGFNPEIGLREGIRSCVIAAKSRQNLQIK